MADHLRVRTLGRGAFGVAVLYRRTDTHELVVVKEIEVAGQPAKVRKQALAESEALSMLHHPNIIMYYDTFDTSTQVLIEMEYADGGTLNDIIAKRHEQYKAVEDDDKKRDLLFKQETVLWYTWQLFSALEHVHAHGLLHRDIKSENLFLTSTNILKLGDFGIAKSMEAAQSAVGTPYYMAPEMFKGLKTTPACDIFSAGCVVHELCSLTRTFGATNIGAVMHRILSSRYTPIDESLYTPQLSALIKAMLEPEPGMRPSAEKVLMGDVLSPHIQRFKHVLRRLEKGSMRHLSSSGTSIHHGVTTSGISSTPSAHAATSPFHASAFGPSKFMTTTGQLRIWGNGKSDTILEEFSGSCFAVSAAISEGHAAVCTADSELWTWRIASLHGDEGDYGQLGHGQSHGSQRTPKRVEALRSIPLRSVATTRDTTLCVTASGGVYSFGSNYDGCLGIGECIEEVVDELRGQDEQEVGDGDPEGEGGDESSAIEGNGLAVQVDQELLNNSFSVSPEIEFDDENVYTPVPLGVLGHVHVERIACGKSHVLALTQSHQVFAWGSGEYGCLGLGTEDTVFTPTEVELTSITKSYPAFIACGPDSSAIVLASGRLLVAGNNHYNKLGLDNIGGVLNKRRTLLAPIPTSVHEEEGLDSAVNCCAVFQQARAFALRNSIARVAFGTDHMAACTIKGQVVTIGSNSKLQLGHHNTSTSGAAVTVQGDLKDHFVVDVSCGDFTTFARTSTGKVFAWGDTTANRIGQHAAAGCGRTSTSILPTPIDSIQRATRVVCRDAATLVVEEKILESQEGRVAVLPSSSSIDDAITEETGAFSEFEHDPEGYHAGDTIASGTWESVAMPAWLMQELAGEVIPISPTSPKAPSSHPVAVDASIQLTSTQSTSDSAHPPYASPWQPDSSDAFGSGAGICSTDEDLHEGEGEGEFEYYADEGDVFELDASELAAKLQTAERIRSLQAERIEQLSKDNERLRKQLQEANAKIQRLEEAAMT
eukprot:m.177819 g.177819  ORF g.177819 m.177819 type:complete len:994 (-) comp14636_c0_seq2:2238-5219(-)